MTIDLNCDLGEGEPVARTRALMSSIGSANVACGGHAGDAATLRATVALARRYRVRLGAHPGAWSRADRGRGRAGVPPADLVLLLLHQVGAISAVAAVERVRLHHIKLHGSLYHAVEADAALARAYIRTVATYWPKTTIYAMAGGRVVELAQRMGVASRAEVFADRAYLPDGRLVERGRPGAVIEDVTVVEHRVRDLIAGRGVTAIDGTRIVCRVDTLCIHADTPGAPRMARAVARLLRRRSRQSR